MEKIPMYAFKANHCWYLTPRDPRYQAAVCEDVQHTSAENFLPVRGINVTISIRLVPVLGTVIEDIILFCYRFAVRG